MVDILTRESPLDREELTRKVQAVHPVTSWSVNNWLEDEPFGHLPDGRFGMAFQGAVSYEGSEPNLAPEVDPPTDSITITLHVRVTKDFLRGSGLGIPRYVTTWFVGLRRVPTERSFRRDDDTATVIKRRAGFATISSLRSDAQRLRLSEDCLLWVSGRGSRHRGAERIMSLPQVARWEASDPPQPRTRGRLYHGPSS